MDIFIRDDCGFEFRNLCFLPMIDSSSSNVESLSSYISRLAEFHGVNARHFYRYVFSEGKKISIKTFYESPSYFNGYRGTTSEILAKLSLAIRHDLSAMTLIPWSFFLDNYEKGVFRKFKKWCPLCFSESSIKYEKLLWSLKSYRICHIHNVRLIEFCPYCGKGQPIINCRSRVGLCDFCNQSLSVEMEVVDSDKQSMLIEDLLSITVSEPILVANFSWKVFLTSLVSAYEIDNIENLEKNLGLGNRTVSQWLRERYKLSLKSFLYVLSVLRLLPSRVIRGDYEFNSSFSTEPMDCLKINVSCRKQKHNIENELKEILFNTHEIITVKEISKKLNRGKSFLRYNYPDLMKKIVSKNNMLRNQLKDLRVSQYRARIRLAIQYHLHNGLYPSINVLDRYLHRDGAMRDFSLFVRLRKEELLNIDKEFY